MQQTEGITDGETATKLAKHLLKLGNASSNVYVNGIVQAYTYGYYGYGREAMIGKNTLSATLSEEQRNVAYGLAEQYRAAKTDADQKAASGKKRIAREAADKKKSVAPDGTEYKKVRFEGEIKKWSEKQKAEVEFIDFIAANFSGNTVYVYESYKNAKGQYVYRDSSGKIHPAPHGMYDNSTGDIYLDLNAGNHGEGLVMNTFAHELYHHIERESPQKARKLAEFLVQELGYKNVGIAVQGQIDKAKRAGHGVEYLMKENGISRTAAERLLYDRAFSDFVADSLETMFTKGNVVEALQKLKSQDAGLFNMIKSFIDEWVKRIRQFYRSHSTISIEGDMVSHLKKFEQIQQMFAEALVDAGENFQAAEVQKNTTVGGGVMYMSRDIENVTEDTVREDLTEVFNGNNVTAKSYIPLAKTTPFAVRYITGYKANLPVIIEKKKSYFDMRENGKFKEDSNHHYHGMGVDGFIEAFGILEDPEYAVREQKNNGSIHYAFISTNENGEEVCVVFQMNVTKPESQMNGYPGGYYNLDITEFVATDEWLESHGVESGVSYKDYLLSFTENSIAYDRSIHGEQMEKARVIDSESAGVAASYDNNRASRNKVTHPDIVVKNESSEAMDIAMDADTESVAPALAEYKESHKGAKFSDRDYTYEALTSKPDMVVTTVGKNVPKNRADVAAEAKRNAAKVGRFDPQTGSVSVHVDDINTDVILSTKGLRHGLRRSQDPLNVPNYVVTVKAGEILKNSIRVNEITPSDDNAGSSYVLMGAAKDANGTYVVRFVVNHYDNSIASMDVLYALNAKKELAATKSPRLTAEPLSVTSSTISIAELLDLVNEYFPDILPEDVLKYYGYDARPEGDLGDDALYSDRDTKSVSNRSLLANAFEGAAKTDMEKQKIQEYREKIDLMNGQEQKLRKLNQQIKELSFAKGKRDTAKIRELRDEATKTANRISIYDKQLLRLESSKPLQDSLKRAKRCRQETKTPPGARKTRLGGVVI